MVFATQIQLIMEKFLVTFFLLLCSLFIGCSTTQNFPSGVAVPVEERTIPEHIDSIEISDDKSDGQETANESKEQTRGSPEITDIQSESPQHVTNTAVIALLEDADKNKTTGNYEQAIASLERGLRIEPKNPLLWHQLSQLRLKQGRWEQAITLAKKSNSLSRDNISLQLKNWLIILRANEANGNKAGAEQARKILKSRSR